jgi:hypothetical protein
MSDDFYCAQEITAPEAVWAEAEKFLGARSPVLFYGVLSYHGLPEYAEKAWEAASEAVRQQWMQQGVLREFLKTGDEMERTYSNAFFMTQGIDLRL